MRDHRFFNTYIITRFIAGFLFACLPVHLHSQEFNSIRYDEKDGLPSPIIYNITQDANGFTWFGTDNGLCRFDGSTFKTYTTNDGLPDNAVLRVFAHNSGRLYFHCFTHPPGYILNDSVYQLKIAPEDVPDLRSSCVFHANGDRMLIVGYGKNSYILDPVTDSVIPVSRVYKGISNNNIGIAYSSDTSFIASTVGNPIQDTFFFVSNKNGLYKKEVYTGSLCGAFFLAGAHKRIDLCERFKTGPSVAGPLKNNHYFFVYKDSVFILDYGTGQIRYTIYSPKTSIVFTDSEDNLWIGTQRNGVFRIPSLSFRALHLPVHPEIYSISASNNTIVLGGEGSTVHQLTSGNKQLSSSIDFTTYLQQSQNRIPSSTNSNRILRVIPDGDTLYIASDAFLLKRLPSSQLLMSKVFPVKDIDTSGRDLLVATGTGAYIIDRSDLSIKKILLQERTTCGIFYRGNYYIGMQGGLAMIRAKDGSVVKSTHPALQNRIMAMRRGNDNDLWIATSGAGLIHYKDTTVLRIFKTDSGLPSDVCTSVFIDGQHLWIGTSKGVTHLRADGSDIYTFARSTGLSENFINAVFVYDSTVYAGTNNGLTYFSISTPQTKSICRLQILSLSQGGKTLKKDNAYTFPSSALNIRIDFTAISFKSEGENTYWYKLEGLDTSWIQTSNTFVNYPTLPHGSYRFSIKAVNKFGVESETITIAITINPPWWQTWWFLTLAGIAFAAAVFLIYRRNINAIKKREKARRSNDAKLAALEQQALQAQMNPHFIFNCLNSIQSFILDLDAEGANQYLSAFASMIRQTLDISSHPLISIADETRYLDTYLQLEKLRFREKFTYRIQVAEEIDTFSSWIPGMLLQPYVENSLRHGIQHRNDNNGVISIEVRTYKQGGLVCLISDNGIGRKRSEAMKSKRHIEYQSKGTSISSKRVNAINNQFNTNIHIDTSDIHDSNGEVAGTLVSIIIPELRKP